MTLGDGRFGGRRLGARADLRVALAGDETLGIMPWYSVDRVAYGGVSKVASPNTRWGQTFGLSVIYAIRTLEKKEQDGNREE